MDQHGQRLISIGRQFGRNTAAMNEAIDRALNPPMVLIESGELEQWAMEARQWTDEQLQSVRTILIQESKRRKHERERTV